MKENEVRNKLSELLRKIHLEYDEIVFIRPDFIQIEFRKGFVSISFYDLGNLESHGFNFVSIEYDSGKYGITMFLTVREDDVK